MSTDDIPKDEAEREIFKETIELTIKQKTDADDVNVLSFGRRRLEESGSSSLNVLFELVRWLVCEDGDCDNVVDEEVAAAAANVAEQLESSMKDGSFGASLAQNAKDFGVTVLENVSVDAESLTTEDPIVQIVTATPTVAPTREAMVDGWYPFVQFFMSFFQILITLLEAFARRLSVANSEPGCKTQCSQ